MKNKLKTINEVALLSGITVRTLHYYDEINLLKPHSMTNNGYRLYDDICLKRLQQILFFKELNFPLKQIKSIINNESYDEVKVLTSHRKMLVLKRDRLNDLIELIDNMIGGENMSFKEFDMTKIEEAKEKYTKEAEQRWGDSLAFKQSQSKTKGYTKDDWKRISRNSENIFKEFAECMNSDCDDIKSNMLVERWKEHITKNYYECTDEILLGLADMYVNDKRFAKNIDKYGTGLAEFMSIAIKKYCSR